MVRRHPLVSEAVLSAGAAASLAALLAWLGPPGSDLAAHVYQRALFLEHGFALWNNFWYAGRYSFVTYSLLYYPLAGAARDQAARGRDVATAALAFAVVVSREWGPTARWSSRTFAVVWAAIVLSGAFPFALGVALALLALWALQAGARWRFAALAVLTLAASPLAFLLLALVLAGIGLARRDARRSCVAPAAVARRSPVVGELVLWRLFPAGGRFPFSPPSSLPRASSAGSGSCSPGASSARACCAGSLLVYLVACLGSFVVPSSASARTSRGSATRRSRSRC